MSRLRSPLFRTLLLLMASALAATACLSGGGETDAGTDIDDGLQALSASEGGQQESSTGADEARAGSGEADADRRSASTIAVVADDGTGSATADGTDAQDKTGGSDEGTTDSTTNAAGGDETSDPDASAPTTATPATTAAPTTSPQTTVAQTTAPAPTAGGGSGGDYFATLPPGASLPSGESCASRVKSRPEIRSRNSAANNTRGTSSNGRYPRVDGNFVGTTDEVIQWAACKWGIDEDWARAQAAMESWWDQDAGGDRTSDQSECHPSLRTNGGDCPESTGLMQVRYLYHLEAFDGANAIRSTAYNADYAFAAWRECFEGELRYLNQQDRGAEYAAGDLEGCLGTWFSGRWYVDRARTYIAEVRQLRDGRIWEQSRFQD